MATPISSADIALSELNTAPGGGTYSDMRFQNLARPGWSEGTLGSGAFSNYTWGLDGSSGGADAIYGLTPTSGEFSLGTFADLIYYFDGSPFEITYAFDNLLTAPPGPVPPPNANDISIEFVITDSALDYSIFGGPNTPPNFQVSFGMPASTANGATLIPGFNPDTYPLVRDVYWIVRAQCAPQFGGGALYIEINGSSVLSGAGLSPGANDFDYTSAGAASGLTNGTGISFYFELR